MANNLPDQITGMRLAANAYVEPKDGYPESQKLSGKWIDLKDAGTNTPLKEGYGDQKNASGVLENRFVVKVNRETNQVVFSFKGSDALSNWVSDLLNGGASEYRKIVDKAQAVYDQLKVDPRLAGYSFSTTGHSLGGSMAQMFGLKNGLDTQVYNSLPLAKAMFADYFGSTDINKVIADYKASGHTVSDVRQPNDIATFFYQAPVWGPYLSQQMGQPVTLLPGAFLPEAAKTVALMGLLPFALPAFGIDHMMGSLFAGSSGLGIDANGHFILPAGDTASFAAIPSSARDYLSQQDSSPVSKIQAGDGNTFTITRQNGAQQWLKVDPATGDTVLQQRNDIGFSELTIHKDGGYSEITRYANGQIGEHTVSALGTIVGYRAALPAGVTLGPNQFYVDRVANNFDTISALTGVSVSTLLGLNSGLGLTSGSQTIVPGEVINLQGPTNLINIAINSDPKPQTQVQSENKAIQDIANGFVQNSPTSKVSFSGDLLNKTDFASTQMASLTTGGVRPGEFQLDPNAKPGKYLGQFYADPASTRNSNVFGMNAAVLNGLSAMTTFNTYIDPLLLDLTGNGVGMTGIENGVLFDVDHSGTLKRTGWADSHTGMLVVDDGTGQITSASQMLSEYFGGRAGANGGRGQAPFKDGFAALASLDANHDGVIDTNDPIWNRLKVWVDADHNGKTGMGELKTLEELGITQLKVASTPAASGETINGNQVLGRGSFVMNGQTRQSMAVDFLADPVGTTFAPADGGMKITSAGGGATRKAWSSTAVASETLDAGKLGVDNVYAGKGDTTLIAAPTGSWLVGGGGSNTYQGSAGDDVFVISAKDKSGNIHGNGGRDTAIIVGDQGVTLNMNQAGLTIAEGGRGNDVIVSGGNTSVFIKGGTGSATLIGGGGNDVIVGGSGHSTIIGGTGKAVIYAGPNGDTIYASAGGSIIHAGGGNDRIYGGAADDIIEAGHGNAVIDGGAGTNVVTLHGNHGDYSIAKTTDGYSVTDSTAGRDGVLSLRNIQKLNFADISAVDLTLPNAMPVADALRSDATGGAFNRTQPHLISAAQLLANDQRLESRGNLHITTVGDALGGTVSLTKSGDVLFTPNASFTGVMSFKYSVADDAGNPAATVVDLNSGQTAPMRATATLLTPEIPTDPLTSKEWYLTDTNVLPVWSDYTGKGVRIGQFEPGGQFATAPEILNIHHPDLAANVDPVWLQTQQAGRTLPTNVSNHATMVAGVMVAAKNGQGGVGVAYDATVGGYYLANSGADLSGLGHMVSYDIANNSWGFTNDFALSSLQRGQINTESALVSNAQYAADNGRGGLGTIIVTAGGNQREKGGSAQGSLTNNNRFSIEVGAINAQGDLSTLQIGSAPFSNPGASLLVSAPGSNVVSTSEMLQTDQGSTFGSDYSAMQGTSFATPIVSGVVALMLQANPNLGYRDVQKILALSARTVNDAATKWDTNGAHNWNGGGMHTSHDYGFGEVDARAAVRLAESWLTQSTGANEAMYSAASGSLGQAITPGSTFSSSLNMQAGLTVEHAEIDFDANVGRLGDLVVTLIAPNGTRSILLNREGKIPAGVKGASDADVGSTQSGKFGYTFMSTHDWGEQSAGSWKLEVTDAATGQPVTLNNWALRLYGSPTTADDTYYYTDEFAAQVAASSARGTLDDAVNGNRGGRNTINAAAVSGDTSVDLTTGIASIGGTRLTIAHPETIQNIVTGDGNDTLKANNADAVLDGGRGNNTLIGGSGKDYFVVHRRTGGSDTIVNFAANRGEVIDLVGFKGKSFANLKLSQDGANVRIDLGDGQSIVLQNQSVSSLTAAQFQFQDTFVAPAAYINSQAPSGNPNSGAGTVVLGGGAQGVSYTTDASGKTIASLAGTVYSHDSATSDTFVIQNQPGATSFRNALRGFRHGVDKIDLSQTGVTSFADLVVEQRNRATINGIAQIHGVSVGSKSLGANGTPAELVYLDALDFAQVTESDFIFAKDAPKPAGVVTAPPSPTPPVTNPITPVIPPVTVNPVTPAILPVTGKPIPPITGNPIPPVTINPVPPVTVPPIKPITFPPIEPIKPITIPGLGTGKPIPPITGNPIPLVTINPVPPVTVPPIKPITFPPIEPIKSITIPGFGPAKLSGHSPSYRMIDSAKAWESDSLSSLFTIPQGDTLTYRTTLANGSPLPAWLTYDPAQNKLRAASGAGGTGTVDIKVTAVNQSGVSVDSTLELLVQANVLNVDTFQKVNVTDSQVAINESNAFSGVTATGGDHVLLLSGSATTATLQGTGSNTVTVAGGSGNLTLGDGNNTVRLVGSGATVVAGNGANNVTGSDGSAKITLGNGNNTVSGAFQTLTVGSGTNTVTSTGSIATLNLGDGHDVATVSGSISTVNVGHGNYDLNFSGFAGKVKFGSDVAADHLWFRHVGQDLDISVIGSAEKVVLRDWYASSPHQADITSGDGKTVSNFNVEKLVQAMAAFSPPAAGATSLTPNQQAALQPVLAANWH
ncbi:S8 family serine peptidase [Burkholderia stagnalis]